MKLALTLTSMVCLAVSLVHAQEAAKPDAQGRIETPLPKPAPAPPALSDFANGWLMGLDRAHKKAEADKKDLLLFFTGSDWCPPCIDLVEHVFSKPDFIGEAAKHFVLVELDVPRDLKKLSQALRKANEDAGERYVITAYPTIVLADPQGRPYARTGWQADDRTPAKFLAHLEGLRKKKAERDQHLASAAKAEGQAKAASIAKALAELKPREVVNFYGPEFDQAVAADPTGGGLRQVVFFKKKEALENELNVMGAAKEWKKILARIDAFIAAESLDPREKQEMLFFKLGSHYQLGETDVIFALVKDIIALGAETPSGKQAAQFRDIIEQEIQAKKDKAENDKRDAQNTLPKAPDTPKN